MTNDELKKEATEYALEWGDKTDGTYACCRDGYLAGAEPREKRILELEAQIEKMKLQYDYAFNQLCKSREILCSMLSQYRNRKEIDYSLRDCGEKLLKEGVFKNDR